MRRIVGIDALTGSGGQSALGKRFTGLEFPPYRRMPTIQHQIELVQQETELVQLEREASLSSREEKEGEREREGGEANC
jgi:hypothetical protein